MAEKNSFVLRTSYEPIVAKLSDNQAGTLFKAILRYMAANEEPAGLKDGVVAMAFSFIKQDLDYNKSKYEETCQKRKEAISKRWNTKDTNVYKCISENTKNTNVDFVIHNDVDSDSDIEKEKLKKEKVSCSLPLFADFWERYPKKTTKKECADWWKKNPAKRQAAIDGLEYYKRNTDPQYYLDPIRYLKRERWLDKPEGWQGPISAPSAPKPEERPLSAEELAEKRRWDSLTEAERKAELDAIRGG